MLPAPQVEFSEPWRSLKPHIHLRDIPTIAFEQNEIDTIEEFCEKFFPRKVMERNKHFYPQAVGRSVNPNARGIRGELAVLRYFSPHLANLTSFLTDRPWKMSDMGDAIIIGRKAKIFDTKTRARKVTPKTMLSDDSYVAELDTKFLDRNRYGYLQCFIFCASNIPKNEVYLMGWMDIKDIAKYGEVYKAGQLVPHAGIPYSNDFLCIPYRRLNPITELLGLEYYPITAEMSYTMRNDYETKRKKKIDGKQYISAFGI